MKSVIETKTQLLLRDYYEVRLPEIHSTSLEGEISKFMEQTNKDFKSLKFMLTNSPTPQTFSCWEMRFQTEVCSCSKFPTEAMLWIKEVEVVNSVDDLKSLCFIQGIMTFHDFELLDARIASAL